MRLSLLPILAAIVLAVATPVASARPIDPPASPVQNLSSPDAQDANAAQNAQTLQDLARLHAGAAISGTTDPKIVSALAQQRYYATSGKAAPVQHRTVADDSSPLPAIGIGLALIALVAGSVAVAVRTRQRTMRVAV
jgi:hypothetical protein